MKKRNIIILICIVILLLIGGISSVLIYRHAKRRPVAVEKDFSKLDLTGVENIMFVAHPDDDSIWGGAHLLENGEKYLVVCVTCGVRKDRVEEFKTVMEKLGSKYVMLGWPDKTNGEKDNWETSKEGIKNDIEEILNLKEWNLIVTHNPNGEYGHIHHAMTSEIVTEFADKEKLVYFGKYYPKSTIDDHKDEFEPLGDEDYQEKYDLIGLYTSQSFVYDMFGHMFRYENWLKYGEWNHEK